MNSGYSLFNESYDLDSAMYFKELSISCLAYQYPQKDYFGKKDSTKEFLDLIFKPHRLNQEQVKAHEEKHIIDIILAGEPGFFGELSATLYEKKASLMPNVLGTINWDIMRQRKSLMLYKDKKIKSIFLPIISKMEEFKKEIIIEKQYMGLESPLSFLIPQVSLDELLSLTKSLIEHHKTLI